MRLSKLGLKIAQTLVQYLTEVNTTISNSYYATEKAYQGFHYAYNTVSYFWSAANAQPAPETQKYHGMYGITRAREVAALFQFIKDEDDFEEGLTRTEGRSGLLNAGLGIDYDNLDTQTDYYKEDLEHILTFLSSDKLYYRSTLGKMILDEIANLFFIKVSEPVSELDEDDDDFDEVEEDFDLPAEHLEAPEAKLAAAVYRNVSERLQQPQVLEAHRRSPSKPFAR